MFVKDCGNSSSTFYLYIFIKTLINIFHRYKIQNQLITTKILHFSRGVYELKRANWVVGFYF